MRSMIWIIAAVVGIGMAAPAEAAAQNRPDRPAAEKKKDGERGASANAARAQNRGQAQRPDQAQGRGQGQRPDQAQGRGQGQRPDRAQGQRPDRRGPPAHARRGGPPPDLETYNRGLVERATRARSRRNGDAPRVEVRREGGELRVVRSNDGQLLFALDQDRAEDLGYWRAVVAPTVETAARSQDRDRDRRDGGIFGGLGDDEGRRGPPAFCRSGEGHPVWGRGWCLDKGFGLGDDRARWGRVTDIGDIILRSPRTDRQRLDRGGLIDVLGDIVFGRLAVQSLVLGAREPLTGTWIGRDDDGPRILRVHSGDIPVAELVAVDDGRVEMMVINIGD